MNAMRVRTTLAVLVMTVGCHREPSLPVKDGDLALLLAAESTRYKAIAQIVASRANSVPLLLSWTDKPPSGLGPLEEYQLNIGIAEAFGRLRSKEAIPFLIRNLNLKKFHATYVWTRTPDVILGRLPSVAALIEIGPEASKAVMKSYGRGGLDVDDRLDAIFIVSRVPGVPEARSFLHSAIGDANMQRAIAEEGLAFLEKHP